jgi:hypothetical protein
MVSGLRRISAAIDIIILAALFITVNSSTSQAYLIMVDTVSEDFTDPQAVAQMAFLNGSLGSAYDGAAVYLVDPYDTAPHPPSSFSREFGPAVARMQGIAHPTAVWPMVLWNRIVRYNPCAGSTNPSWCSDSTYPVPSGAVSYYESINGIDLYNRVGALTAFLNIFSDALQAAKALGSPGIVIDTESYNNYKIENVPLLATLYPGKSDQDIINRFKAIGSQMADIVNAVYPDAVILDLSTHLFTTQRPWPASPETYVWQGMLDQAKAQQYRFTLVDGGQGMDELGYCHPSLNGSNGLEAAVSNFSAEFAPFLRRYPNLQLGGTIVPWASSSQLSGWLLRNPPQISAGYCGQAAQTLTTAEDFIPLMQYLFTSYQYVWVFAVWDARYSPYYAALSHNPAAVEPAMAINQALQNAK